MKSENNENITDQQETNSENNENIADQQEINSENNENITDQQETNSEPSLKDSKSSKKPTPQPKKIDLEIKEWKNEYLYLKAEFDNFKKQSIKERSELIKFSSKHIISEMITIVDLLEQALEQKLNSQNAKVIVDGVQMTLKELKRVLGNFGLEEIVKKNSEFDPSIHEAVSAEESNDVPEGNIISVFKKAYKLYDRVIRPAQVVVAKKAIEKKEQDKNTESDN